jgi:signal transduction histidine kinase
MSAQALGRHPRHWPLVWKGGLVIATSTVLFLAVAVTSYTLERNTAAATADMLRSVQLQGEIQRLHVLLAEAATGVRGYLLTGRDDFLTPYRTASEQLPGTLASLNAKVRDPEQIERLQRVLPLVQSKLDSLDRMRGQRNASSAELQQHLLDSKQILDQLRAEIGAMNQREAVLVAQRTLALQQATNRNLWTTVTVIPVGLAGTLATLLFIIGLVRRVRLTAENAERLTLDLPLAPAPAATDELGQLAGRLHQASMLLAGRASAGQAASSAKTEFLARTSHELRTPLNAILGYAQLLEADCGEPRDRERAAQIRVAGQHLLSLINEVLDIGRIEAGQLTLPCVPVTVAPLAAEALALVLPQANQRAVELRQAEVAPSCAVMADRQRLLQVMLNVLSNAVKYSASGSAISISCSAEDGMTAIHIDDGGPGIAASLRHRLFAPFDRLGAERSKTEGVGLGLAVSKALMQAMQGDIRHVALPGSGSRFTLTLPAATSVSAPAGEAAPDGSPQPGQQAGQQTGQQSDQQNAPVQQPAPSTASHHVLCIEDDGATRALIAALVQRRPQWRLSIAFDLAGGMAVAQQLPPDLILLAAGLAKGADDADALAAVAPSAALALLGEPAQAVPGSWRKLAKPLMVPEFFALLESMEHTR